MRLSSYTKRYRISPDSGLDASPARGMVDFRNVVILDFGVVSRQGSNGLLARDGDYIPPERLEPRSSSPCFQGVLESQQALLEDTDPHGLQNSSRTQSYTLMTLSGFNCTTHYQRPSDDYKPYILCLHGFPSSAHHWRHQVGYFANEFYGIIDPGTLGYGGTSKPLDPAAYRLKAIDDSLIEVVDKAAGKGLKVLGVGHDWWVSYPAREQRKSAVAFVLGRFFGSSRDVMDKRSAVLSCMATFHSDRFLAYAFLAGGYSTPGPLDLDAINAFTMQILGYNAIGY